jgi:uncharacterized protein YndB with AHSA1/START domain
MTNSETASTEFTLTWTLDASATEVFQAWTDPDHLDWFYNDAYPAPAEPIELDLQVGGVWRQFMIVDDDTAYYTGGVYREIVPDEKLVFSWGAAGGWPELDPDRLDASPLVTVILGRAGGRTELTVHVELPAAFAAGDMPEGWFGHIQSGWSDTVDRLAAKVRSESRSAEDVRR